MSACRSSKAEKVSVAGVPGTVAAGASDGGDVSDRRLVELEREDFLRDLARSRLRLFRASLQAEVCRISPLAAPLAAMANLDMDEVSRRMGPFGSWPERLGSPSATAIRWLLPCLPDRRARDRTAYRIYRQGGYPLSLRPRGWIGWQVVGRTLEVAGQLGSCSFATSRGTLRVRMPVALPEVVQSAMVGRRVADVVELPVFTYPDWRVAALEQPLSGGLVLKIRTGELRHEMPWRSLLDAMAAVRLNGPIDDDVGF